MIDGDELPTSLMDNCIWKVCLDYICCNYYVYYFQLFYTIQNPPLFLTFTTFVKTYGSLSAFQYLYQKNYTQRIELKKSIKGYDTTNSFQI